MSRKDVPLIKKRLLSVVITSCWTCSESKRSRIRTLWNYHRILRDPCAYFLIYPDNDEMLKWKVSFGTRFVNLCPHQYPAKRRMLSIAALGLKTGLPNVDLVIRKCSTTEIQLKRQAEHNWKTDYMMVFCYHYYHSQELFLGGMIS